MKTKIDNLNETVDQNDEDEEEISKPEKQQKHQKAIKDLRRMSHAINLPTLSKLLTQVPDSSNQLPFSPNRSVSRKYTAKMMTEEGQFGLTEDIYASREGIKIEEEKSQESSKSNFRYVLSY